MPSRREPSSNIHDKSLTTRHGGCCFGNEIKLFILPILFLPLAAAHADTFGSGANTFTMDFVTIGNSGNLDDNTGYGGVGYTYRMGVHEVSRGMIDAYIALSNPDLTMADMIAFGGNGVNRPATGISWNEAARFVNWLNTSKGFSAAYKFTTGGRNDNIALWTNIDAGYNAANPYRNANAHYFLPSEDEWYKAAYYDPNKSGGAGYWDYATGSDTAPVTTSGGTLTGTAVYRDGVNPNPPGPADITNAGGLSSYGTMGQNGNVRELTESNLSVNDPFVIGFQRVVYGGSWTVDESTIRASNRSGNTPGFEDVNNGFRVAAVPEPSALLLTLIGALGGVTRRRR
jgi:formylglycine-generating enzyme